MDELTQQLLSILDRIELTTNDPEIERLTGQRFELAKQHGYVVKFRGESSGRIH